MKIKHLHGDIGELNGNLYFELKEKLVIAFVGTPKFNNSGEWILYDFKILNESSENHKSLDLKPYNIKKIKISKQDHLTIDSFSKCPDYDTYPEYEGMMLRMAYEEGKFYILIDDRKIPLSKWKNKDNLSNNYGLYNILIPMLKETILTLEG